MSGTLDNGAEKKTLAEKAREVGLTEQHEREALAKKQGEPYPRVTPGGVEVILDPSESSNAKPAEPADTTSFGESRAKGIINKGSFEDNILSQFDNIIYNIRLYMTSETVTHESLPSADIFVIAETGSTGFNILDLQMDTIVSPSTRTKNTLATSAVIKIMEPFGTSLFDHIRTGAGALGVFDHHATPMWLDVRFKGYVSGHDESYEGGAPSNLSNETRTWKLRVKKVDVEMSKGGTEYTMHLIPQDEQAMEDSARILESDITLSASTLGDFFKKLSTRLNKFTSNDLLIKKDRVENIRKYVFSLPGDIIVIPPASREKLNKPSDGTHSQLYMDSNIRDWEIRGHTTKKSAKTATFSKEKPESGNKTNEWQISFKKGTTIESIVQQVIGSTDQGQSLLLFGEEKKKIATASARNPILPSIAFIVDPTVAIDSYNDIARAYNITITYGIRVYQTFAPIISRKHKEDAESKKHNKNRLKNMFKIANIKKKYDYMFTGENTEILDYKIELNSAWFLSLPLFQGQGRGNHPTSGRNEADIASGRISQTKSDVLVDSIRKLRTELVELRKDEKTPNKIPEDNDEISARTNAILQKEDTLSKLEKEARLRTATPLSDGKVNTFAQGYTQKLSRLPTDARPPGTVTPNTTTSDGSIFFVEDFAELTSEEKQNIVKDRNKKIREVSVQISPTDAPPEGNIEGTRDADRSFFSSAMNQVYGFKGQLINLDLEIRGDPYWLGEPNAHKRLTNSDGFVDHTKTDSLIVITFKFPVSIDDGGNEKRGESYNGTGLYKLERRENGFNGIYNIVKVENSFSGGRFTQRLTGYIDPLTGEQGLISEINEMENNGG